jgi:hypothetical protein
MNFGYYEYKGNRYYIIKSVEMKDPHSGLWVEAYLYRQYGYHKEFVREKTDFEEKFKLEKKEKQ